MNQLPVAVATGGNRGMGLATCQALAGKRISCLAYQ